MTGPRWPDPRVVEAIHARQIAEHGGEPGVRDPLLLSSALARPQNIHAYESESADWARLAAAYLVGICGNHPSIDGNKRTAAVVCEYFLNMNGLMLEADDVDWYNVVMSVAKNEMIEQAVVEWLRQRLRSDS